MARLKIVLVTDGTTPPGARDWLAALGVARRVMTTDVTTASPGAVRNAGIRASRSAFIVCIDAGDVFDDGFHRTAASVLETQSEVAIATSLVHFRGPGHPPATSAQTQCTLEDLVRDSEAIHPASMFRREAWTALGGYDERLPALEAYDFYLRLLQRGGSVKVIPRPLLIRTAREDALFRRAWDDDQHAPAFARIASKHSALFAIDPAASLTARETKLGALTVEHRELLTRRDNYLAEIDELKTRAAELRNDLPPDTELLDLGDLRRTSPLSREWGYERGKPIDRHYIEQFLDCNAAAIHGDVLEVQEPDYTRHFGGGRVTRSDVLDLDAGNPKATVTSDLRCAANLASASYDCIILTQTLHVVDDMPAVVSECARLLRPGGVLLATLPAASRVCLEYGHDNDFWRVTEAGVRRVFSPFFPADALEIRTVGNVLVNAAFLYGLAAHELTDDEFTATDPYFPLLVTVRAEKATEGARAARMRQTRESTLEPRAAILLYHRVSTTNQNVHGLAIEPAQFRRQMAHLAQCYHPMGLVDLIDAVDDGRVPSGAVAVTFDDGYLDNYLEASPVLLEYSVPATFLVTTERLDEDYEFWWDALERVLLTPAAPLPPQLLVELPEGVTSLPSVTYAQRLTAYWHVYHAIAGTPALTRDAVVRTVLEWSGAEQPDHLPHRRMRSEEVIALASRHGHTIGAHSETHVRLSCQTPEVQRAEIEGSRRTLARLLSQPVSAFAYPFGDFDNGVLASAGLSFDLALTCEEAVLTAGLNRSRLPRFEVTPKRSGNFEVWLATILGGGSAHDRTGSQSVPYRPAT